MSAGRQGPTRAKDFENLNKEARNTKRRRCDDFALPSSRPSGVPPTENKRVTSDEMQEEIIPFDIRQRSTEAVPAVDSRTDSQIYSASVGSFRLPLNESCTLESLRRLAALPRFATVSQQPSIFQSLYPNQISNSVSSFPAFNMPLNQYQLVQDIGRAHHVYDETRSLGALLSLLRGNSVANFNDLSLQAQRTSLAQMHFINNSLGNFPSLESASVNGEVNGSFVLAEHIQSLRNAQNVSTVSNPRTDEPSLQNQRQDIEDCNAVRLTLYISDDDVKLNENQIFLRQNIELFRATQKDILCITRGKNKPIVLHQVGIRCCHCSHVPAGRRKKGSTYFPSNLIGLYQAAQNLCVEHLQSGLCTELPPDVKERFVAFASGKKSGASSAGKKYWAEAGRKLGLIDTDDGIHFASDRVDDRQTWESADYVGQRAAMADRFA